MWGDAEAQKLVLLLRAINYNFGMQTYSMVFITTLEGISAISNTLSEEGDTVAGVIAVTTDSQNGKCCIARSPLR